MKLHTWGRFLVICLYIFGFLGALFAWDLGPFSLLPYRVVLLLLIGLAVTISVFQIKLDLSSFIHIRHQLIFLLLWMIYAAISITWAIDVFNGIRVLALLYSGLILILATTYFSRTWRDFQILQAVWMVSTAGLLCVAGWEILTGANLPTSKFFGVVDERLKFIPTATFDNPNDFATVLTLSFGFGMAAAIHQGNLFVRIFGCLIAAGAFVTIAIIGSRGNLLAISFQIFVVLVFYIRFYQRLVILLLLLFATGLALWLNLAIEPIVKAENELATLSDISRYESGSLRNRINLIRNGATFLWQTGGLGVGVGNVEYWMSQYAIYPTGGLINPHNWWLEILVNYGVFIFFGYLLMYLSVLYGLIRARVYLEPVEKRIADSLSLSLVGFSLGAVSSSSVIGILPHWMLFGFALAYLGWVRRAVSGRGGTGCD